MGTQNLCRWLNLVCGLSCNSVPVKGEAVTWKLATWLVWTGPCSIFLEQTPFCPSTSGQLCFHAQGLMLAADTWPGVWAGICKKIHIP